MAFNPFQSIPIPKIGRTNFDESHELAGTFPLAKMCPVFFTRTLPGDSWKINVFNLTKLETLIAPAMQRMDASILWFKIPERLVFKHFKNWYSGGNDGNDNHQKPHFHLFKFAEYVKNTLMPLPIHWSAAAVKKFTEENFGPGSLWNYLGLPTPLTYNQSTGVWEVLPIDQWNATSVQVDDDSDFIDLMPILAYNFLYDTCFRDQTLNDPIFVAAEDGNFTINKTYRFNLPGGYTTAFGPNTGASTRTSGLDLSEGGEVAIPDVICLLQLFNRAWRKDYYTSCQPDPQRGPEVTLNIAGDAPVKVADDRSYASLGFTPENDPGAYFTGGAVYMGQSQVDQNDPLQSSTSSGNVSDLGLARVEGLVADVSGLSPITIVALRNLFKLQQFLEKNQVGGGRYIETILAHWAERVPDFTVQRPQFIRATSIPVQISEVTATANSAGVQSLVGDQAGRARTQGNLGFVRFYTQEPSFIFGLYCVTAPPTYAGQGIPRIFQHVTRFDEPWRDFQHIGEQAVKSRELYFSFAQASLNKQDFGYQQRYSEYKFMPSRIVGDFQTSLAFWHMARMFDSQPSLNGDFVTQNLDPRIFAVQSDRPVTASFYFEATAKRKLSKYSTPKLT